jgi:hypothetical protein
MGSFTTVLNISHDCEGVFIIQPPAKQRSQVQIIMRLVIYSSSLSCNLTFQSLAVTLHTARFNIKQFYVVPTLRLCVLYGSQNKRQLLPYKTLRDWFL